MRSSPTAPCEVSGDGSRWTTLLGSLDTTDPAFNIVLP